MLNQAQKGTLCSAECIILSVRSFCNFVVILVVLPAKRDLPVRGPPWAILAHGRSGLKEARAAISAMVSHCGSFKRHYYIPLEIAKTIRLF